MSVTDPWTHMGFMHSIVSLKLGVTVKVMMFQGDPVPCLGIQLERTDSSVPVPIRGGFALILGLSHLVATPSNTILL